MLGRIRKFSSSIYAKVLLALVIIPFVFWGMGSNFSGGNRNVLVSIDNEKYSVQNFIDFIQKYVYSNEKISPIQIDEFLYTFIGEKLINEEVERLGITLTDKSLTNLIKYQKGFRRDNEFSRVEYEKFLLKNNVTASNFEKMLAADEKRKQLINFIGGGIIPSKFMVDIEYNKVNQKRYIEIINLNTLFKKKFNFTEDQINTYFSNNKKSYSETFKKINVLELNPKVLVGSEEFNDIFFKKIDEIDDMIVQGENINDILNKFNLEKPNIYEINKDGIDKDSKKSLDLPNNILKNIFNLSESEPTYFVENKEKYFIIELIETNIDQKKIDDEKIRKDVIMNLEKKVKRELISQILEKINTNKFSKLEFDKLSSNENVSIKQITLDNQKDDKIIKKELVEQIYIAPTKKVIMVHDINLSENYLIYVNKVEKKNISENTEEYKKYLNLSANKISNELYITYDKFLKNKYKIDINYQSLEKVKNYFN